MLTQKHLDALQAAGVLQVEQEGNGVVVYRLTFNLHPHVHTPAELHPTQANRPPWAFVGVWQDDAWRAVRAKGMRKAKHRFNTNLKVAKQ